MLQIPIHNPQHLAAGSLPSPQHGSGQASFVVATNDLQLREFFLQSLGHFGSVIGAIVIHHNQLIASRQNRV